MKDMASEIPKALDRGVDKAAENIVKLTQKMPPVNVASSGYGALGIPVAPKYGGTMRQMIHVNNLGRLRKEILADTDYAVYVHDGTYKMQARPFFKWALEEFGGMEIIEATIQEELDKLVGGSSGTSVSARMV